MSKEGEHIWRPWGVLAFGSLCVLVLAVGAGGFVGTAGAANTTVFDSPLNESVVQHETGDGGGGDIELVLNETVVAADDGSALTAADVQVRGVVTEAGDVVSFGANESATAGSYRVSNVIGNSSTSRRIVVELQQYDAGNSTWEPYDPAYFDSLELNLSAVETASGVQSDPGWVNVTRLGRDIDRGDTSIDTILDALPVAVGNTETLVGLDANASNVTVTVTDLNGTQVLSRTTGASHVVPFDTSRLVAGHTYAVTFSNTSEAVETTQYINGTTLSAGATLNGTLFEVGSTRNISVTLDTNRPALADETASALLRRDDGEIVAAVRNLPYDLSGNITHQFPQPSALDTFPKRGSYEIVAADDITSIGGTAQQFEITCGVVGAETTLDQPGCYNLSASQTNVTATDGVYLEIASDNVTFDGRGAVIDANDTATPEVGIAVDPPSAGGVLTGVTVRNVTLQQFNTTGLDAIDAENLTIADVGLFDNGDAGIDVRDATNVTLQATNTSGHTGEFAAGVTATNVTNLHIERATAVANNGSGVGVASSRRVTVTSGQFVDNLESGLEVFDTTNLTVRTTNASAQTGAIARGVDLDTVTNATIADTLAINNNGTGIEVGGSSGVTATNVTATDNLAGGTLAFESDGVVVQDSTFLRNGDDGFFAFNSTDVTVRATNASLQTASLATGVGFLNVSGITVGNVTALGNNGTGIQTVRSGDILVDGVRAVENVEQGVGVFNATNATVRATNASAQTGVLARGVDFDTVTDGAITDVTALGNNGTGVDIRDSAAVSARNVTARTNRDDGLDARRATDVSVTDSEFVGNRDAGIYARNATNLSIRNSNVSNQTGASGRGLNIQNVSALQATNLTAIENNQSGVLVYQGANVTVRDLRSLRNREYGLTISNTTTTTVRDVQTRGGRSGITLTEITNLSARNISAAQSSTVGVGLGNVTGRARNVSAVATETGVGLSAIESTFTLDDVRAVDSVNGVGIAESTGGTLGNLTVRNNSRSGFVLANVTGLTLRDSVARANQYGLNLTEQVSNSTAGRTVNNTVTNVTLASNTVDVVAGGTDANPSRATNADLTLGSIPVVADLRFGSLTATASVPTPPQSWTSTGVAVDYATLPTGASAANLSVDYTDRLGNEVESSLDLWGYDVSGEPGTEQWVQLNGSLQTGTNTISAPLSAASRPVALLANETNSPSPPTPSVDVRSTTVDFGEVAVGETATTSVTVANTGDAPLGVTGVTLDSSVFAVASAPTVVDAGDTATVNLTFTPTGATTTTATATIETNDTDTDLALSGTGLAGNLALSTDSLSFGEHDVAAGNLTASLVVSNTGSAPLTVDSLAVTGDAFALVNGTTETLAVGDETAVTVAFDPATGGDANGTLTLQTDDPDRPTATVALSGTGLAPNLSVTPATVAFGNVTAGERATANLTVANTGTAALTLDTISAAGSAFTVTNTGAASLAPGESTQIAVTFAPSVVGAYASNLTIATNDPAAGRGTVSLSGTALSSTLTLSPLTLDFGNVSVGTTVSETVRVTNPSATALNLSALRVTGPDAGNVTVTPAAPLSLDPQEGRTLTVSITPAAREPFNATLVPERAGVAIARIGLHATARGPDIDVSPTSVSFTNATVNETSQRNVTVRNVGAEPLSLTGARVGGAGFSVPNLTATLQPGSATTLPVSFAPERPGARAATVRIRSDDPADPVTRVFLSSTRANVDIQVNESDGQRAVTSTVENATAGESTDIPLPGADEVDEGEAAAAFEQVSVTPERTESFTVNVTTSDDPLNSTPQFAGAPNGTTPLSYANITHSIPNANISQATVRTRISRDRLAELQSSPEDVSLYRFVNGTWTAQPTRVVARTNTSVVLVANASGFSEWTTAARRPQFDITGTTVNVTTATVGDAITIEVFVTNNGGADGIYEAELLLNDVVVDRRSANIPDGGTTQLNFLRTFENPGLYELQVNDVPISEINVSAENRSVEVSDAPSNGTVQARSNDSDTGDAADGTDGGDGNSNAGGDGPPILLIAGALALLAVGGGVAYARLSGDDESQSTRAPAETSVAEEGEDGPTANDTANVPDDETDRDS